MQMFGELLTRRAQLAKQRDETEIELVKVAQLIEAIYPLLPPEKQKSYEEAMERVQSDLPGLQDAIRLLFSVHRGKWLSALDVRERLKEMGFNFRNYQANPLSAISTTLRRLAPDFLEVNSDGEALKFRLPALPKFDYAPVIPKGINFPNLAALMEEFEPTTSKVARALADATEKKKK